MKPCQRFRFLIRGVLIQRYISQRVRIKPNPQELRIDVAARKHWSNSAQEFACTLEALQLSVVVCPEATPCGLAERETLGTTRATAPALEALPAPDGANDDIAATPVVVARSVVQLCKRDEQ